MVPDLGLFFQNQESDKYLISLWNFPFPHKVALGRKMCSCRLSIHSWYCAWLITLTIWFVQWSWLSVPSMMCTCIYRLNLNTVSASRNWVTKPSHWHRPCIHTGVNWLLPWADKDLQESVQSRAVRMISNQNVMNWSQHNLLSTPRDANWYGILFLTKLTLCPTVVMKYYIIEFFKLKLFF